MTELEKKQLKAFNTMIDIRCEEIGVRDTIHMLYTDYEFTIEELRDMGFDANDIKIVIGR